MTRSALGGLSSCMLVCALVGIGGCGEDRPVVPPGAAPAPAAAPATPSGSYRVVAAIEHAGRIAGVCRLVGRPDPARIEPWPAMGADEPRDDESVVVGEKSALGGCVVSLAAVAEGKDWPPAMRSDDRSTTLTVVNGRYEPHLAVVRTSTQLEIVSQIAHDIIVHGFLTTTATPTATDTIFNFSVGPGATMSNVAEAFLNRPGVVWVTDDRRHHFTAWTHVVANPYFDVTRAPATEGHVAGEFRLDGVPAGDYDLVCWHEPMDRRARFTKERFTDYTLGPPIVIRRRVHVTAGSTTTVDFDVEQPARK